MNTTEYGRAIHAYIQGCGRQYAAIREAQARTQARAKLRPRLRWLVDHPRLLGLLYRVVPNWRPVVPPVRLDSSQGVRGQTPTEVIVDEAAGLDLSKVPLSPDGNHIWATRLPPDQIVTED